MRSDDLFAGTGGLIEGAFGRSYKSTLRPITPADNRRSVGKQRRLCRWRLAAYLEEMFNYRNR